MPIIGNAATTTLSGNVMFQFDTDFDEKVITKQGYIDVFAKNVKDYWGSLQYKGVGVTVNVTFGPYVEGASGWKLIVGNGSEKADLAKALFSQQSATAKAKISFVRSAQEDGDMFLSKDAGEAVHEFGHMVRLSDRYVNGILRRKTKDVKTIDDFFSRTTAPLSRCFSKELDQEADAKSGAPYDPATNLMAAPKQAQSTLTERQLGFVFSNQSEPRYSFNGWVYEAIDGDSETDGQPVWFGKGITKLSTRDGITHRQKKGTDPTARVDLLAAYQI